MRLGMTWSQCKCDGTVWFRDLWPHYRRSRHRILADVKAQDFAITGFPANIAEAPEYVEASIIEIHQEGFASASACRQGSQLKQPGKNMVTVAVERTCQRYFGAISGEQNWRWRLD